MKIMLVMAVLASLLVICMMSFRSRAPLLERVAELEHEQWMAWSKSVAPEVSAERRARWEKYWVPYDQLPEDIKELDRDWARKVLREVGRQ